MILVVDQTNFTFFLRLATSTAGFVWATYGEFRIDAHSIFFFREGERLIDSIFSIDYLHGRQSTGKS